VPLLEIRVREHREMERILRRRYVPSAGGSTPYAKVRLRQCGAASLISRDFLKKQVAEDLAQLITVYVCVYDGYNSVNWKEAPATHYSTGVARGSVGCAHQG